MSTWTVEDICTWLGDLGLSQYSELFRTNAIDGKELPNLDSKILAKDLGIGKLLFVIKRFFRDNYCKFFSQNQ